MKRLFIICIYAFACIICSAKSVTIDGVTYKFYSYKYSEAFFLVERIDPKLSEVTIHGKISYEGKEYQVEFRANDFRNQPLSSKNCPLLRTIVLDDNFTEIPHGYWKNGKITKVVLPNGIKEIKRSAFEGCFNLKSVNIPNSVTSIGMEAFEYCSSLQSITIPNSVKYIGVGAFRGCSSLQSINYSQFCNIYRYGGI